MMRNRNHIVTMVICACLSGCMSPKGAAERTVSEMRALWLDEFRFGQTEPIEILTYLDATARRGHAAFSLDYVAVREARHAAEVEWLAVRRADTSMPKVRSPMHTGWVPPLPNPGFALTVTVAQNGTNAISFHDALSILCSVSGLKWQVVQSKVIVTPDVKPD